MGKEEENDWGDHSNHYTETDISIFEKILPTLLSEIARKSPWARKEQKEMMERFKRNFGGEPLEINDGGTE